MKSLHEALQEFGEKKPLLKGKEKIKDIQIWWAILNDFVDWVDKNYGDTVV